MADPIPPEQVSDEAALLPIQDVIAYLQEHLGQRMTAYISGVKDPKMVHRWIARQNLPRDESQIRLREAYQATRLLVDAYGDETAKAWLFGSNAELGARRRRTCCARRATGRISARSSRRRARSRA